MIIIVTGSVGTGKSVIAKELARNLKFQYIDLNKLIKKDNLQSRYLRKLDTYEVDVKKLNKFLIKLIKTSKRNLILDSHLSHYLPSKYVNYCVVCKTELKTLKKRLEKRKYTKIKIRENLNAEIFDVCLVEALENKHRLIVVDTSKKTVNQCAKEIIKRIV